MPADYDTLKAAFDKLDTDGSGRIDIGELQNLLPAVGIDNNGVTLWKAMESLDQNIPYGQVDFDEFYQFMQSHHSGDTSFGQAMVVPENLESWNARLEQLKGVNPGDHVVIHSDIKGTSPMTEKDFMARYPLGKKLGSGKYASVHKCQDNVGDPARNIPKGHPMAMKIFHKKNRTKKKFYEVIDEAIKMRKVNDHPNVVNVYDLVETQERLIMLIEFVAGGQLYDEIINRKPTESGKGHFNEQMASKIVYEMTSAIAHMHKHSVIHCDLKPENVLCTHNPSTDHFDVKVADMGLSKILEPGIKQHLTYCGTPLYMAPEMLRKHDYNFEVDLWSIGCMMHELMCGEPPFTGKSMQDLERNVKTYEGLKEDTSVTRRIQRQFVRYGVSEEAQDLIGRFLNHNAKDRIKAVDALDHPWLRERQKLRTDHMGNVALSLEVGNDKRKFRRAVNKILLSKFVLNSIRFAGKNYEHKATSPKAAPAARGDAHEQEEAGCECVTM
jgi:serine/threonine protein kinase